MDFPVLAAIVAFVVVVLLVLVYLSVRVVQQYEKMIIFRLGRTNEAMVRDPGINFLIPIVDRPVKVDVREQFIEVPSQTTITKDNAPISVDFLIYWRISEPLKSVVNVANFAGALQGVATTTLRAVIGDILLDEVLSKREQINEVLRTKLDEVTERWGGKVTTVEIREITPPRDVQDAMNRQLSAERTRRAVITESEGSRQSAINVAEGQKQSEILKAEGDRQAAILRAEGFSQALTRIFQAATGIDEKTMALQYLDASRRWARARRRSSSSRRSSPGSSSRSPATSRRACPARTSRPDDEDPRRRRRSQRPATPPVHAEAGRLQRRRRR
ncbi:MAG TPA: SPFH domain-containing protein [Candidatus Limnocylindrales bacterium]|nr:SPFH domain-containing protein [Candidatus Limnocylindrales bacterium]